MTFVDAFVSFLLSFVLSTENGTCSALDKILIFIYVHTNPVFCLNPYQHNSMNNHSLIIMGSMTEQSYAIVSKTAATLNQLSVCGNRQI